MARIALTLALVTTLLGGLAPAASASHGSSGCESKPVNSPYYHQDFWGRWWIYAHAQSSCTIGAVTLTVQANLQQHYGGRWNWVGNASPNDEVWGSRYNKTDKPAAVRCTAPYTPYYFRTYASGYMNIFRSGWFTTTPHVGQAKVMYC